MRRRGVANITQEDGSVVAAYAVTPVFLWFHVNPRTCEVAARLQYGEVTRTKRLTRKSWNDDESVCAVCGKYVNWADRVEE